MLTEFGLALTLIARANVYDGHQLPAMAFIDNVSPAINDQGTVAFKFLSVMDGQRGMLIVPKGESSALAHGCGMEHFLTDASITPNEHIYFSEFSEAGPIGLYQYDHERKLHKIYSSEDLYEYSALGTPVANNEGFCVRVTKGNGPRASREVACSRNGELFKVFGEGQAVRGNERASYLFTPAFNAKGAFAAKIRLGARGDWGEEQADIIALVEGEKVQAILSDADGDPSSEWARFNNSVTLNEKGEIALVATRKDRKSCLVVASRTSVEVKVCDGEGGIKEIEYFTPQINELSSVAFRAKNDEGKRQVYLMKKGETSPVALIGEGDFVPTDLGFDTILFRKGFPGLSGNVGINNKDEVAFHAVLTKSGAGIFVVRNSLSP